MARDGHGWTGQPHDATMMVVGRKFEEKDVGLALGVDAGAWGSFTAMLAAKEVQVTCGHTAEHDSAPSLRTTGDTRTRLCGRLEGLSGSRREVP